MEQKDIHNDDEDFFEVKKTSIFPLEDFIIPKDVPKLPIIYEEKEKEPNDEHNVDFMEQYQKMKLDDVFGL